MNIAGRLTAMTSELPQPIIVGEPHRNAPDAQDRRRLSFTVAAGDRSLAEVAIIPNSGVPMKPRDGNPTPARYQENALDIADAGEAHRLKFIVGARLRYLGPSDENPPAGLAAGDIVTVAERNGCGMGIDVVGPDGGVDMVWWYEVELMP